MYISTNQQILCVNCTNTTSLAIAVTTIKILLQDSFESSFHSKVKLIDALRIKPSTFTSTKKKTSNVCVYAARRQRTRKSDRWGHTLHPYGEVYRWKAGSKIFPPQILIRLEWKASNHFLLYDFFKIWKRSGKFTLIIGNLFLIIPHENYNFQEKKEGHFKSASKLYVLAFLIIIC